MNRLAVLRILVLLLVSAIMTTRASEHANNNKRAVRGLGSKMRKNGSTPSPASKYPWDATKTKNSQQTLSYTEFMKSFMKPDEEPFRDDYYEDYDFEFPKGMIRNDVFEVKKNKDMAKRLQDGL